MAAAAATQRTSGVCGPREDVARRGDAVAQMAATGHGQRWPSAWWWVDDVGVGDLPSGTVTLLFSDIEGSTLLLSRLGATYADALDAQRRMLRKAWGAHGGTELGTEGDGFFVVFPTADGAVAAAVQAQRELEGFDWPGGERVRVRIGIHTGSPQLHEGGYVGMDLHRAARIAGAAHGGQVVVSSATAHLVEGSLPQGMVFHDLGSHRLKDLPMAERLYQLQIDGLRTDFAPLKSLGAASNLPRPATPLVGRGGELAELTALMGSPDVRLVTLTGPGGSGKTRLAIALAQHRVEGYPDGVFYVPLAAVTTADEMWTSIAETLDVPPEARTAPGLLTHLAHRSALFVLDNLEQVADADDVVARLLQQGPQIVVLTTSRRALSVPGEHVHPVPPLELPDNDSCDQPGRVGAVQMFVVYAQMVRPSFALEGNAADVSAICRRLDGLPLAIELAAARTRLLSPSALLTRLDKALDLAATGKQGPSRQRTLRDTVAWSYNLLTAHEQAAFRRLGVFAGGADLDAITAVTGDVLVGDPLDLVANLVDASLVTIGEDGDGEPRVAMLETIRAYAQDQLRLTGEASSVSRAHAMHYLTRAEQLDADGSSSGGDRVLRARRRFEFDSDNYREALRWALPSDQPSTVPADRVQIGLGLCANLSQMWWDAGNYLEAQLWLSRGIAAPSEEDSPELGQCLFAFATFMLMTGDHPAAFEAASRSVAMYRRLENERRLVYPLTMLGRTARALGDVRYARKCFEEAIALGRTTHNQQGEAEAVGALAQLEFMEGNLERRLELDKSALAISQRLGDDFAVLTARYDIACSLRLLGRLDEAHAHMHEVIPQMVKVARSHARTSLAEDYAALLIDLGHSECAVPLIGAADASRERSGINRTPEEDAELERPFADARTSVPPKTWDREYRRGRLISVEDALLEAHSVQFGPT